MHWYGFRELKLLFSLTKEEAEKVIADLRHLAAHADNACESLVLTIIANDLAAQLRERLASRGEASSPPAEDPDASPGPNFFS